MKKLILICVAAAMLLAFSACSLNKADSNESKTNNTQTSVPTQKTEEKPQAEPEDKPETPEAQNDAKQEEPETNEPTQNEQTPEQEGKLQENDAKASDGGSAIEMPILDEIFDSTEIDTENADSTAVKSAETLLDWAANTGLGADEIKDAAIAWKNGRSTDDQAQMKEKLKNIDGYYEYLVGAVQGELPEESAPAGDDTYAWGKGRNDVVEAIMEAFDLR